MPLEEKKTMKNTAQSMPSEQWYYARSRSSTQQVLSVFCPVL
jgi:hypothetical protein